jgi:hypothetical protein
VTPLAVELFASRDERLDGVERVAAAHAVAETFDVRPPQHPEIVHVSP